MNLAWLDPRKHLGSISVALLAVSILFTLYTWMRLRRARAEYQRLQQEVQQSERDYEAYQGRMESQEHSMGRLRPAKPERIFVLPDSPTPAVWREPESPVDPAQRPDTRRSDAPRAAPGARRHAKPLPRRIILMELGVAALAVLFFLRVLRLFRRSAGDGKATPKL